MRFDARSGPFDTRACTTRSFENFGRSIPCRRSLRLLGMDTAFLGAPVEDDVAVEVAEGRLDPISRQPFVVPPSPQKQRGWNPRNAARGAGGRPAPPAERPKARPAAFANLFSAPSKKKTVGAATDSPRFDEGDYLDDDAVAEMMERMEKENAGSERTDGDAGRSDASRAAGEAAAKRVELGDAWTPTTGALAANGDAGGGARTSWVPAAFARGGSAAPAPAPAPGESTGGATGGPSFGFEPTSVVRAVEPTRTRPATKPCDDRRSGVESLCEIRAAKKPTAKGALASLFAREAKRLEERVVTVESDATRPAVPVESTTTKEKVGAGAPKRDPSSICSHGHLDEG